MKTRRLARISALLLLTALLVTCQEKVQDVPTPGWLRLNLTTPNADDGGLLMTITGAVDSVRTTHPHLLTQRESPSSMRVIVVGTLSNGTIAEIRVADTRQASQYNAVVQEVAARVTYQQRSGNGYSITVVAPQ